MVSYFLFIDFTECLIEFPLKKNGSFIIIIVSFLHHFYIFFLYLISLSFFLLWLSLYLFQRMSCYRLLSSSFSPSLLIFLSFLILFLHSNVKYLSSSTLFLPLLPFNSFSISFLKQTLHQVYVFLLIMDYQKLFSLSFLYFLSLSFFYFLLILFHCHILFSLSLDKIWFVWVLSSSLFFWVHINLLCFVSISWSLILFFFSLLLSVYYVYISFNLFLYQINEHLHKSFSSLFLFFFFYWHTIWLSRYTFPMSTDNVWLLRDLYFPSYIISFKFYHCTKIGPFLYFCFLCYICCLEKIFKSLFLSFIIHFLFKKSHRHSTWWIWLNFHQPFKKCSILTPDIRN